MGNAEKELIRGAIVINVKLIVSRETQTRTIIDELFVIKTHAVELLFETSRVCDEKQRSKIFFSSIMRINKSHSERRVPDG